jgi:hypothetical protein
LRSLALYIILRMLFIGHRQIKEQYKKLKLNFMETENIDVRTDHHFLLLKLDELIRDYASLEPSRQVSFGPEGIKMKSTLLTSAASPNIDIPKDER